VSDIFCTACGRHFYCAVKYALHKATDSDFAWFFAE